MADDRLHKSLICVDIDGAVWNDTVTHCQRTNERLLESDISIAYPAIRALGVLMHFVQLIVEDSAEPVGYVQVEINSKQIVFELQLYGDIEMCIFICRLPMLLRWN